MIISGTKGQILVSLTLWKNQKISLNSVKFLWSCFPQTELWAQETGKPFLLLLFASHCRENLRDCLLG